MTAMSRIQKRMPVWNFKISSWAKKISRKILHKSKLPTAINDCTQKIMNSLCWIRQKNHQPIAKIIEVHDSWEAFKIIISALNKIWGNRITIMLHHLSLLRKDCLLAINFLWELLRMWLFFARPQPMARPAHKNRISINSNNNISNLFQLHV